MFPIIKYIESAVKKNLLKIIGDWKKRSLLPYYQEPPTMVELCLFLFLFKNLLLLRHASGFVYVLWVKSLSGKQSSFRTFLSKVQEGCNISMKKMCFLVVLFRPFLTWVYFACFQNSLYEECCHGIVGDDVGQRCFGANPNASGVTRCLPNGLDRFKLVHKYPGRPTNQR